MTDNALREKVAEAREHDPHYIYPLRARVGRSASNQRVTTSGITWESPEKVPGAILPALVQQRLQERLRALDEHTQRARVESASYVIYR